MKSSVFHYSCNWWVTYNIKYALIETIQIKVKSCTPPRRTLGSLSEFFWRYCCSKALFRPNISIHWHCTRAGSNTFCYSPKLLQIFQGFQWYLYLGVSRGIWNAPGLFQWVNYSIFSCHFTEITGNDRKWTNFQIFFKFYFHFWVMKIHR